MRFAGWRFSVLEMQAIAAIVIENFEFALPSQTQIERKPTIIMAPMTPDRSGVWMGLEVKSCAPST